MLTEEKVNITKRETYDTCSVNYRYTNNKKYSTIVLLTIQHNIETFFRNLPPSKFSLSFKGQDLVAQESVGVNSTVLRRALSKNKIGRIKTLFVV